MCIRDRTAAPRTGNGILAASAFWRWAVDTAACLGVAEDACASPIGDEPWTGGGLHVAVDDAASASECAVLLGVEDGAFVRRLPVEAGTYECEPAFTATAPG